MFECLREGLDRTNNAIESHHHIINIIGGRSHLGLYELANLLSSNQTKMEHAIKTFMKQGAIPAKKSRKRHEHEKALLNLHKLYSDGEMPVMDYLQAVSMNIVMA